MTEKEMLQKLIESGWHMRNYQKAYFQERDKEKRRELLIKSKQSEREFDNVLFNIKQLIK